MDSEKIIVFRPFAYVRLFDTFKDTEVTIATEGKTIEAKRLFGRLYWIGFP